MDNILDFGASIEMYRRFPQYYMLACINSNKIWALKDDRIILRPTGPLPADEYYVLPAVLFYDFIEKLGEKYAKRKAAYYKRGREDTGRLPSKNRGKDTSGPFSGREQM